MSEDTEKQVPRVETKSEERNWDQEIRRKQDNRRIIAEPRKLVKERKINKRMKTERKGKVRKFKLKLWETSRKNDTKSYSINPTTSIIVARTTEAYEKSTAVSRTNAELDRYSKDSKKVNLIPENPPENSEIKSKSYSCESRFWIWWDYRVKKNRAGPEVKEKRNRWVKANKIWTG